MHPAASIIGLLIIPSVTHGRGLGAELGGAKQIREPNFRISSKVISRQKEQLKMRIYFDAWSRCLHGGPIACHHMRNEALEGQSGSKQVDRVPASSRAMPIRPGHLS